MTLCNKYHIVINAVITVTIFLTFFLLSLIRPTNSNILRGQVGNVKERSGPRRHEATSKMHDLSQTTQILYWVGQKVHLDFSITIYKKPKWTFGPTQYFLASSPMS